MDCKYSCKGCVVRNMWIEMLPPHQTFAIGDDHMDDEFTPALNGENVDSPDAAVWWKL